MSAARIAHLEALIEHLASHIKNEAVLWPLYLQGEIKREKYDNPCITFVSPLLPSAKPSKLNANCWSNATCNSPTSLHEGFIKNGAKCFNLD